MPNANSIDRTLSRLPYVKALFNDKELQDVNTKFDIFSSPSVTREKQVQRLSIVNQYDHEMEFATAGGVQIPLFYHQLMNGISTTDKKRRLIEYRTMAKYSMVSSAIREICNEMFVKDEHGEIVKCNLKGDYNDQVKTLIKDEFQKFIKIFKIDEQGWKLIWDYVVEGELFWENIVSSKEPERGILGLTRIAAERIDPLYYDLDNELIDSYILRAKQQDQYPYQWGKSSLGQYNTENQQRLIFMNDRQITYIFNNDWEETAKKYKIPLLAEAHRAYRQLSLIEDATVIYMLVRAPQRLHFSVDVGSLPPSKQEQYIQRLMAKWWTKKTISSNGQVENTYDPQSMLENIYTAKTGDGRGTEVTPIQGGDASPDNLEILNFFVKKLYDSLHVPISRLNSDTAFADGENISREELRFAVHIINIQKQFAWAIKQTFITHLKLKGKRLIKNAKELNVHDIDVKVDNIDQKVKIQDVYLHNDSYTPQCWNYHYIIDEAVNKKLNETFTSLNEKKEKVLEIMGSKHKKGEMLFEKLHYHIQQLVIETAESGKLEDVIKERIQSAMTETMDDLTIENIKLEMSMIDKDIVLLENQLDNLNNQIDKMKELKDDHNSWWESYKLQEEDIDIKLNEPTQFFTIRQQQEKQLKLDNYTNMVANDMINPILMLKQELGWDDRKVLANIEWQRRVAALRWELAQIEANGPDFREKALKEMSGAMGGEDLDLSGLGGGAGPGLPSGGGAPNTDNKLPDFGNAPQKSNEGGGESPTPGNSSEPPTPNTESYIIPPNHRFINENIDRKNYIESVTKFNKEKFNNDLIILLND